MGKKVLLVLFIFASYCPIFGSANCEKLALNICQEAGSKHYVRANQIALSDEGILIFLEDIDLIANSVFHDDCGFYYLEDGVQWICRNCGTLNDLDEYECHRCHEPQ
jgi:hypothetical protein